MMFFLLIVLLTIMIVNGFRPNYYQQIKYNNNQQLTLNMINTGRNQYIDINGGKICYDYFQYSKKPTIGIYQYSIFYYS